MGYEEFFIELYAKHNVLMWLKQEARPLTLEEMGRIGERMIAALANVDGDFYKSPAQIDALKKNNLRLAARQLVMERQIVQIGNERFGLPGQAHKYRFIDDYWEC